MVDLTESREIGSSEGTKLDGWPTHRPELWKVFGQVKWRDVPSEKSERELTISSSSFPPTIGSANISYPYRRYRPTPTVREERDQNAFSLVSFGLAIGLTI